MSLVDQSDPHRNAWNCIPMRVNCIFYYIRFFWYTKSSKDAYPNDGLRLQNILNAENTHIHARTHTNTHTHGTHTLIEAHYNMNDVNAGKLLSFCHFFNVTVKFEWCGGGQWVYIIFEFLNILYIYYIFMKLYDYTCLGYNSVWIIKKIHWQ